jgi:hypothetical protein
MLPDMLDQIPSGQPINMVTADGADDTCACHAALRRAAGPLRSFHPARTTSRGGKQPQGAVARNKALRSCRRHGRAIRKRWTGDYRRSLVAAKTRGFRLPGERVMTRDFDRHVAEPQIRAAILNRFTAPGAPATQRAG